MKTLLIASGGSFSCAAPGARDDGQTTCSTGGPHRWLPLALVLLLPGCATIRDGATQTLSIDTPGAPGADCAISTGKGKSLATVTTPGEVHLRSRKSALTVACHRDGFQDALQMLPSTFNKRSRFQGPPGLLVDALSGAMWRFPERISILMQPPDAAVAAPVLPPAETAQ